MSWWTSVCLQRSEGHSAKVSTQLCSTFRQWFKYRFIYFIESLKTIKITFLLYLVIPDSVSAQYLVYIVSTRTQTYHDKGLDPLLHHLTYVSRCTFVHQCFQMTVCEHILPVILFTDFHFRFDLVKCLNYRHIFTLVIQFLSVQLFQGIKPILTRDWIQCVTSIHTLLCTQGDLPGTEEVALVTTC